MLAVHEAGHLIIGVLVGRRPSHVSLDEVDRRRGCAWEPGTECGWDDISEMLCLLAGPRAQVSLLPHSVNPEKLSRFQERIIQPTQNQWQLPEGIYDCTGWDNDVIPVYKFLTMPDIPEDLDLSLGTTRRQVVDRAEERLKRYFSKNEIQRATERIAVSLLASRRVNAPDAVRLVHQEGDLWKGQWGWKSQKFQ